MSQAFWFGTGEMYNGTVWFRRVANRSTGFVNLFDRSILIPADAVTILLIGLGLTTTVGWPLHAATLECESFSELSANLGFIYESTHLH